MQPQSALRGHPRLPPPRGCAGQGRGGGENRALKEKLYTKKSWIGRDGNTTGIFALPCTGNLSSTKERILLFVPPSASLRANRSPASARLPCALLLLPVKMDPSISYNNLFLLQGIFQGGGEIGRNTQRQDPKKSVSASCHQTIPQKNKCQVKFHKPP